MSDGTLEAPEHAKPGDTLGTVLTGGPDDGELVLLSPDGVLLSRWKAGETVRLPPHLPAGPSRLEHWKRGRRRGTHVLEIREPPARRHARASIVRHHGRPALAIDGQPCSGLTYTTYHPREEFVDRFAAIGTRLLSFPTTCDYHVFDLAPPAAVGPDRFDFSFVDHVATRLLDRQPDGWILPRVFVSSPPWWDELNPEAEGHAHEDESRMPLQMVHDDGEIAKTCASWASPRWRDWAADALRRYVAHLRASPYADRVIGICLASGGTEEWFHWHDERRPSRWGDLGPVAEAAFRIWLRRRYRGDVESLCRAWNRPVEFESAEVPTLEALQSSTFGIWRDPERERPAIDFLRFHQEQVASAIAGLAGVARDECEGEWVVGAFYGYVLVHTGHHRHINGGHFALDRLLRSRTVDFLCAPTAYGSRSLGSGYSHFMAPIESLQHHGVLWFSENDIRTHLLEVPGDRASALYRDGYGLTDDVEEGQSIQLRELGHCLQRGTPQWWFDIYAPGQFDDPALADVLTRLRSIHDALFEDDRRSVAEVAVFVDERAPLYEDGWGRAFLESVPAAREALARFGAPVDEFLLDDLPDVRPYRLSIFLNAVAPTRRVREAIQRLRASSPTTRLWLGPCGLVRSDRIDDRGPSRLTGLPLAVSHSPYGPLIVEVPERGALRRSAGLRWGHADVTAPRVEPTAVTGAEVWAQGMDGRPAVVARTTSIGGRDVFAMAPAPPAAFLRDVAEQAGVHLYLETGEALSVSATSITIHGFRDGQVVLRLPQAAPLYEPWTRQPLSPRAQEHVIPLERGQTRLVFLGRPSDWKQLERRAARRRKRSSE